MTADRALAARRFFAAAINDYGITEGDLVRIPMRQCDLARQRNVAASTVGAYLTAMGPAVVARHPEIIIANSAPTASEPITTAPATGEVLQLVAELFEVQARLIRALAHGVNEAGDVGADPREIRGSARISRGSGADLQQPRKEVALPSSPHASNRAIRAETPRGSARYDELLQPLHRLCSDLHLTPLNNRSVLEHALDPYDNDQIADAVHDIARQTRAGTLRVQSPFGLLVARARRGDLGPAPLPTMPCPQPAPSVTDGPALDDEDDALVRVTALELDADGAQLLKTLDAAIATESPGLRMRPLPLPMRRALRAEALRQLGDADQPAH